MPRDDLAARLRIALEDRDDVALASVLNPDVRLVFDTGDETGGEFRGRARVIRVLGAGLMRHPDAALRPVHVNGDPGLALRRPDGEVVGVLGIGTPGIDVLGGGGSGCIGGIGGIGRPDSIDALWLTTAPHKLALWNRRRPDID